YPKSSSARIRDVTGQLVTPAKRADMPAAAQSMGDTPRSVPTAHPKEAPTHRVGTISPPLNPAPSVTAVKSIFRRKASQETWPSKLSSIRGDRKSTRLNSSNVSISYAVFCLKKKTHEKKK